MAVEASSCSCSNFMSSSKLWTKEPLTLPSMKMGTRNCAVVVCVYVDEYVCVCVCMCALYVCHNVLV